MDLPTYTNIWRIEKRLYKLYDFRLPMPLPINWIAVFAGITVPYIFLLVAVGLPFNHTLVWLYVLPPGLLTWLTTRPVIENKRLPELMESQVRYLAEPRVWCRLAPLSEKDQVIVTARVWHSRRPPQRRKAAARSEGTGAVALRERGTLARRGRAAAVPATGDPAEGNAPLAAASALAAAPATVPARSRARSRVRGTGGPRHPVPGPSGRQRPAGAKVPPSGEDWAAQQREAAQQAHSAQETWPGQRARATGQQTPGGRQDETARQRDRTAKPGRFRLAALRSRPAGPAPALPPGVALRPPAGSARSRPAGLAPSGQAGGLRPWPEGPSRFGQDGPEHGMRAARAARPAGASGSAPPLGSVPAPVPSSLPAHATPDVYPATDARASAEPSPAELVPPDLPAHVTPDVRPATGAPAPPEVRPGTPPSPRADGRPASTSQSGTAGAPRVEIAHDGLAQRSAPSAPVGPVNPVPARPAAVGPLHPAPEAASPATPAPGAQGPASETTARPGAVPEDRRPEAADATEEAGDAERAEPAPTIAAAEPSEAGEVPEAEETEAAEEAEEARAVEAGHETGVIPAAAEFVEDLARVEALARVDASPPVEEAFPPVEEALPTVAQPPAGAPAPAEPLRIAEPSPPQEAQPPTEPAPPVEVVRPLPVPVVTAEHLAVPSIERALSGPARDRDLSWHGTVKVVARTAQGPGKRDQEALDRNRARLPLKTPKRVLVLGCTSGGGQTMTALMTGHILASLRDEPVAAVDLHDGTLARYTAPAAWLEDVLSGKAPQSAGTARPDGLHPAATAAPARLDVIASREPLRDGDELRLAVQLNRHYSLAMLDPGAMGLTKLLKVADQLVIVVPASVDGAGALADTRDWLQAHGFAELASHSVTVINGVSRRSLPDVEHAESVARGRCRAIVRVPWDDMLPVEVASPSALRPQTRVAYTALAGVLVAGLAAAPVRTGQ